MPRQVHGTGNRVTKGTRNQGAEAVDDHTGLHRHADRRQLQQIIAGLSEGVILVEPDQTIAWANEAALAMHGVREAAELGADVTAYRQRFELRYRNRHQLEADDHPMARVLAGEAFRDVVVEVTPAGEEEARWTHSVRSLVLTDDAGEPDCLVLVLHDATERYDAEERFERAFGSNPAPAIICRLADLRYVKVNHGFLEMTGYTREGVIGRSVYEIDVLERAAKKELAVERLNDWRTIPQMEAELRLEGGGTRSVVVAGQPIEIGEDRCMLFTFVDLEPRRQAEAALRRSEERFARAFQLAPVPMLIVASDGFRILDVNAAFTKATGHAAIEAVGRSVPELHLWRSPPALDNLVREVATAGGARNIEAELRTKDGGGLDCLVSMEAVDLHGTPCALVVLQEITEHRRSEAELLEAIEAVMRDTSWFSRTVIEKLANLRRPRTDRAVGSLGDLTSRERDVLGLVCQGLADKEIAERLGLSHSTVRNGVSSILRKIGARRRAEAIVWARERGFTGPDDR